MHPDVVDLYIEGELPELWAQGPSRDGRWLLAEERKLLHVLRETRARTRRARRADEPRERRAA